MASYLDKTGPISVMHLWIKEIEESKRGPTTDYQIGGSSVGTEGHFSRTSNRNM